MKALNIPINTISQITGLSAEEIQGFVNLLRICSETTNN